MIRSGSLVWRLGIYLLVVQAVLVTIFVILLHHRLRTFQKEQTILGLQRSAALIADRVSDGVRSGDIGLVRSLAESDASMGRLRVTVIRPTGQVVADSDRDPGQMDNHIGRPEVVAALSSGSGSAIRYSDTTQIDTVYYATTLVDASSGELVAVLRTALPLAAIDAELGGLFRTTVIASAVWLLLTIIAIVMLSARLSASISRLGAAAARFAAGDLRHRLQPPAGREFAALTRALNEMAHELSARITQLDGTQAEQDAILRSMEAGVIALDANLRVLRLNEAARVMLETGPTDLRGKLLRHVTKQPELDRLVSELLLEDTDPTDELEIGTKGVVARVSGRALRDSGGAPVGVLLVLEDITRIRQLESMRSDFAANVSHELRTPITNIQGYVETLLEDPVEDAVQTRSFLEVIARNANRLGAIVEDILTLTRLEGGDPRSSVEMSPMRLGPLLDRVVRQLESEAAEHQKTLQCDAPTDLSATANGPLLEQALVNLVVNAIRYAPAQTTVTVTAEAIDFAGEAGAALRVADEGPGIGREHLERLFERFYRVDKNRSRQQGGTGLGLAIVKHIALVHGGTVEVESQLGVGSEFSILIPCIGPRADLEPQSASADVGPRVAR